MRIGILPALGGGGGVYQYSLTMLRSLQEWQESGDEFVAFAEAPHPILGSLRASGWIVKPIEPAKYLARSVLQRSGHGGERLLKTWRDIRHQKQPTPLGNDSGIAGTNPAVCRLLRQYGVELMLYPWPLALSFEAEIPYVMAIHDLQHRLQPEFPEVSENGQAERRDYIFRNGARHATLLLADSEVGKEDILNCYGSEGVRFDQIKVLPFLPACYLDTEISISEQRHVRRAFHLPERYLFYPAQFWSHKNHLRIVQALSLLKHIYDLVVPVVFCGANMGEGRDKVFRECMSLARQLGVEHQVHYLGYIVDDDMSALYAGAVALVIPTFFGPTNIPVLEAWAFGCPVLTSDIRGVREQVGDAAILADPRSVASIADGIRLLWIDEALRRHLAERGRKRLARYTPADYRRQLIEIVEEAKTRVRTDKRNSVRRKV